MKLVRYLTFTKFVDLLRTSSLYFARTDLMEDQTEGDWAFHILHKISDDLLQFWREGYLAHKLLYDSLSSIASPTFQDIKNEVSKTMDSQYKDMLELHNDGERYMSDYYGSVEKTISAIQMNMDFYYSAFQFQNKYTDPVESLSIIRERMKISSYLNCWYSSDNMNIGMWKIYGGSEAVAITTTQKKLLELEHNNLDLLSKEKLTFSSNEVIYLSEDEIDLYPEKIYEKYIKDHKYYSHLFKHIAYKDEREYRLVLITPYTNTKKGFYFLIENLNDFIESIFINPLLPKDHWFVKLVEHICSLHNLDLQKINHNRIETNFR